MLAAMIAGAAPTSAMSELYVDQRIFQPGVSDLNDFWNARTYNWIAFDNPFGGLPQMGSAYWRSDLTTNGHIWSNTGDLFDDRDMAYGLAECRANSGNNFDVDVWWCETN
jgi:hypothetical protein